MNYIKNFLTNLEKVLYLFCVFGFGFLIGGIVCRISEGYSLSYVDGVGATFVFMAFVVACMELEVKDVKID